MRKEPHNEWMNIAFVDHQQDPREHGTYVTHTETGEEHSHWAPKQVQAFVDEQDVVFESVEDIASQEVENWFKQIELPSAYRPDDFIIATLYIDGQDPVPQRANLAHTLSLTDAMMCNWQQEGSGDSFEHLGHLRPYRSEGYPATISATPLNLANCFAYEGIYTKTNPQRFDADTLMKVDPKVFKQYTWDAELQSRYLERLNGFWAAHRENYDLLIKASLLRAVFLQYEEGSLSKEDRNQVFDSVGLSHEHTWETLALALIKPAHPVEGFTFRQLILYRYTATAILVIRNEHTGRLVMYIPGNSSPLHGFESLSQLREWITQQCKESKRRAALESQFMLEDRIDGVFLSGLNTALAGLAAYPGRLNDATGHWIPGDIIHLGDAMYPSPFASLQRALEARMASDAVQSIGTRADYDKKVAAQVLGTCITVTGAVAIAVPALWLPLAAMSVALTGLGADEAMHGKSAQDRQEGASRALFGMLNALPLLTEGTAAAGELVTAARRAGDGLVEGAADEVGQKFASLSQEERDAAQDVQRQQEAQDAQARASQAAESNDEREQRLAQEERERLARKALLGKPVDASAFGVEPEGLRALSAGLRTELAHFEYTSPLGDLSGAWGVDDLGAVFTSSDAETGVVSRFARVHAKVYPVEPVPAAGQYRIISLEHSEIKGPYLKRLKGFYSDIDLKPGLRGGESLIEVPPEPMPEGSNDEITLIRREPQVIIEIPRDGIEVRPGVDGAQRPADLYYANNVPGGTRVRYDADLACWRENTTKLLWRDNRGVWKSGDEKAFLKVKHDLYFAVDSEIYTFPRVPGISPKTKALELEIHQVWLGNKAPREGLINTMKRNVASNSHIRFTLHLDIDFDNELINSEVEKVRNAFAEHPNMTVSELADEPFFLSDFLESAETAEPFNYFRTGSGQNLAAASDVLRYRLIREYGGMYLDCDDVLGEGFVGAQLQAGPDDVLTGGPVSSSSTSYFGPANSHFASHPDNPVLKALQKEVYVRWQREREALVAMEDVRGEAAEDGSRPYRKKIFEVTGPGVLFDTLKNTRPDYADLLNEKIKPKPGVRSIVYLEHLDRAIDHYMPFANRLKVTPGTENSWH